MKRCAKEEGRTPTGFTPLEPEGTAPTGNSQGLRVVSGGRSPKVRPQTAAGNGGSPQDNGACTGIDFSEIPFSKDEAVEVTYGASKGIRGRVIGPARSMYLGVADVAIRTETGREAWIRPDFLRRLA